VLRRPIETTRITGQVPTASRCLTLRGLAELSSIWPQFIWLAVGSTVNTRDLVKLNNNSIFTHYNSQFLATRDPSRCLEDCETWAYISSMLGRGLLPVLPLMVMFVPPTFGQLPKRVEKCLPYPTLAQEIRDMQTSDPVPPRVRVRVIRVEFDSNDGIPADAREEISTELRSHVFERDADAADLSDLANEIAEVGVRGALQNRGYFAATASAKLTELQSEVQRSVLQRPLVPSLELNTI